MEKENIYSALAIFREKVSSVKKDSDNPFYKSKYADLPSILEAIKEPLKESGLAITHHCRNIDGSFSVITTLACYSTGETIESEFPIFGAKPQEIGSSISYARRYNLLALLDIPTEDDDGNNANNSLRIKTQKTGGVAKNWLNFPELKKAIDGGTDTEVLLTQWIIDNKYELSGDMKKCLRTYCDTGELVAPEWKK